MPSVAEPGWNERSIGAALYHQVFKHKATVVIPNCYYPGDECDILVVRKDLRLVEVEIKVSRSDLKADQHKDKWWNYVGSWGYGSERPPPVPRTHPRGIWKHYYCLPKSIWDDELLMSIAPASGILLMRHNDLGAVRIAVKRQARPRKEAKAIAADDVMDIARLCTTRMWASLEAQERMHHDHQDRLERPCKGCGN